MPPGPPSGLRTRCFSGTASPSVCPRDGRGERDERASEPLTPSLFRPFRPLRPSSGCLDGELEHLTQALLQFGRLVGTRRQRRDP